MSKNTLVECIVSKKPEGKRVELFGTIYHFRPQPDGAHVAEVPDDRHRAAFLRVKEGYRAYEADAPRIVAPRHADPAVNAALLGNGDLKVPTSPRIERDADEATAGLMGSNKIPAELVDSTGRVYQAHEVVQLAYERSGFPQRAWNKMAEEERDARCRDIVDELKLDEANKPKSEATQEKGARDQAAARFHELAGRAPHHKWSVDRILDEIKDLEAEAAKSNAGAGEQAE